MRVYVYVDGFNVYYRALRKTSHKWLNLKALAESLLDPTDQIEKIRYFTARVKPRAAGDDAPRRQQLYISALQTLPILSVHYGRFLPKTKWRPIVHPTWDPPVMVQVHDTEEKGSDVALASYLLDDGYRGRYEAALVMSQDTDLCEPLRMVKDHLKLPIGIGWLDGKQPGRKMQNCTSFVRQVTQARLAGAQFPDRLMGKHGRPIVKPAEWQ